MTKPEVDTQLLPADHPGALERALEVLQNGGLVAFPTDTVYGLGALALDAAAVERIYAAKGRSLEKAIPILLGDPDDLGKVAVEVGEMALKLAARFWPGPLTLVVPRHPSIPEAVSPLPTVAVRVPDHPLARALLRLAGPLAVTSANLSGQAGPSTAQEVLVQLGGRIPLILDGGRTPGGLPSTVVNCVGSEPQVLREGPITLEQINSVLFIAP
jgi:L-threonylcarbamoyladenylate synthase